jgi:putative tricarboxylic transport membrane protein
MRIDKTDFFLGLAAIAFAIIYISMAGNIQNSLLSDEVGASGFPRAVGWLMMGLGALLSLRSLRRGAAVPATGEDDEPEQGMRAHLMAACLLAMLAVFVFAVPWIGYVAATALLLLGVAAYGGATRTRYLPVTALLGALGLWFLFDFTLSIPLPLGSLWTGS